MDTLSEVVARLSSQRASFSGLKADGNWAVNFPAPGGIRFGAVVEGNGWLEVQGEPVPIALSEGDCFLLTYIWDRCAVQREQARSLRGLWCCFWLYSFSDAGREGH